ncbi:MAG: T9SS type A sorting domain-containing protein [Bacteroidetes bacterium]|nr:T9SS type A sorting domain-containing protein [Bacteroidota bacterium]
MRKLLLSALALVALGSGAMAQQKIDNSSEARHRAIKDKTNPFNRKPLGKGGEMVSDWYDVMDIISKSNVGANLQGYVDFLTDDSLNKFVEDDGTIRYGGTTSVGQILDPADDLIELTDKPQNKLTRFVSYKVDSILFRYLYVRNVDSIDDGMGGKAAVVDTVYIHYWKGNQLRRSQFTDGTRYAMPVNGWNRNRRMPANFFAEEKYLLSSGANGVFDTTRANNNNGGFENAWTSKYTSFPAPAGMQIDANPNGSTADLLTGFTWTFKSGVPAVIGTDTAVMVYQQDPSTLPAGTRRNNYFGYGLFLNEGTTGWENTKSYNTAIMALKASSYAVVNGWDGFIAGQAFTNERFVETYFHLSVIGNIGASVADVENVEMSGLFPNPARNITNVRFTLKNSSDAVVTVHNILGQEVESHNLGKVASGKYDYSLNLSNLKPGMYTVSVKAGNSVQTEKLMVTE